MKIDLRIGDSHQVLKSLPDNSVDAVVTDPPYGIAFMGKKWDYQIPTVELWREVLRVLKPGGHALIACGTRTQHRMVCNIEDAGFEIRDVVSWIYGSGFPKSLNIHKKDGRCPDGWGTALKPACEFFTLARKPLSEKTVAANVLKWGTGGINIDGCRVPTSDRLGGGMVSKGRPKVSEGWDRPWMHDPEVTEAKKAESAEKVKNAERLGRFPANLIHDGSDEVLGLFPETKASKANPRNNKPSENVAMSGANLGHISHGHDDNGGSAARFFYCPKASKKDRGDGNNHPTVKPTALMEYLCRLITPPSGVVLDPFMGSGSTGKAAIREGFRFIGVEMNGNYFEIAKGRIDNEQRVED